MEKKYRNTRLKSVLKEPLVYGLGESATENNPEWPRYIRITDIDENNSLCEDTYRTLPPQIASEAMLKEGDILFARSGATVGKTFLYHSIPQGACFAGYLIRARVDKTKILPEFLSYLTKGHKYQAWKKKVCTQSTIQNINAEKYNQLPITLPSIEEQKAIVDSLDETTGKIDARIKILEQEIEKYKQLKLAVIDRMLDIENDNNYANQSNL